ncbi:hypothetical protein [Flavobacterium cerinum]|uniref:Lipoprotein n=1 Tax=Flavobacterium cerinum TaxID=2502784 RepID=A0ABY5IWW7_9FLAO|nr:hypothetical protein [Flavobacterium cerinum]UUC46233.1 hypothetical protein NOX80_03265 [Flavobacterium cerinum]
MKKILVLLFCIQFLSACSSDSDMENTSFELLTIQDVRLPDTFKAGQQTVIYLKYKRPTNCYSFNGIYYEKNGNTITMAIDALRQHLSNCEAVNENLFEVSYPLFLQTSGIHVLRFWQGKNAQGEDQFLIREIDVQE